ncbi:MAG: hypothetical protein HFG41_13260 [Coprococcus sp.]|nr:hypothetical protein [Coprococcus sp.]
MKNKWISTIIICMMAGAIVLTGCGGKDSASKEEASKSESAGEETSGAEEEGKEEIAKDFTLAMTDSYTFTDPQDLDFDQRFVLVGEAGCKLLTDMGNMGYNADKMYEILYAKDGVPVGEYQYFVAPDEENAASLAEFYKSQGQNITVEGNVLYAYSEGDVIEATIVTFASTGTITDETPEAYIEMMKSFNGLMEYE